MSALDWIAIISAITTSGLNVLLIYQIVKQEGKEIRKKKSYEIPLSAQEECE